MGEIVDFCKKVAEDQNKEMKECAVRFLTKFGWEKNNSELFKPDRYQKGSRVFTPESSWLGFRDIASGVQISAIYPDVKICSRTIHMRTPDKAVEVKVKL